MPGNIHEKQLYDSALKLFLSSRFAEAEVMIDKLLAYSPMNYDYFIIKGNIFYLLYKDYENAIKYVSLAAYINSGKDTAYFELIEIYANYVSHLLQQGKTRKALFCLIKYLSLHPADADSDFVATVAGIIFGFHYNINKFARVLSIASRIFPLFNLIIKYNKKYNSIFIDIYSGILRTGHSAQEALAILNSLFSTNDDPNIRDSILINITKILYLSGQYQHAEQVLSKVLNSNDSIYFTLRSNLSATNMLNEKKTVFRRREFTGQRYITSSSLGNIGRFTHQVMQYIGAKLVAQETGADLLTPDWPGFYLFDLDDPLHSGQPYDDYFKYRTDKQFFYRKNKDKIIGIMKPRQIWDEYLKSGLWKLHGRGNTLITLHIRTWDRSDEYLPLEPYMEWLDEVWKEFDKPVLYMCGDDPKNFPKCFDKYAPLTLADLGVIWPGLEYMQEFHIIMNSDAVIATRGDFAAMAATLNVKGRYFVKYDVAKRQMVNCDFWLD